MGRLGGRGQAVAVALSIVVVAACSSDSESTSTAAPVTTVAVEPTPAPTTTAAPTTTVAPTTTAVPTTTAAPTTSDAPTTVADTTAAPTTVAQVEELDAEFDIGGRVMHIVCTGPAPAAGQPTVIFESGLGESHLEWDDVVEELDGTVRACAYDRAGLGSSDVGPRPTTTANQVDDLVALLAAAEVAPPYLLVADSIGGFNVRVFAGDHLADIAGIVLVDARPPDVSRSWLSMLPPETPDEPQPIADERFNVTVFEQSPNRNDEFLDIATSTDQALAVQSFGDVPLVALVAGVYPDFGLEPDLQAQWEALWQESQETQAALSTNGRTEVVAGSDHFIPNNDPAAVVAAIGDVLAAING